ncbi:MAG: hypothetical protein CME62_14300 [Halobacteriovoraceae bacterium]|nr:hypothetical protein [Halobacteriovoraceae bacterium]
MKKKVIIAMGLAVLSTSALASKARLEALGQSADGSQWIDDARNVLLNPARLNYHKDFVTMEWGQTSNTTDQASTPRAEGGVFKASGNMIYGLYFGSESNKSNGYRTALGLTEEQNNTDLFVAGDAGVQWGARLTYHNYKDEQAANEVESSAMRLTVGIISGDTDAFLNFGLTNKAEEDNGNELDGKGSIDLGVTHSVNDMSYMVRFQSINAEEADSGDELKAQNIWLGAGKMYKLNDKASAWAEAWYKMDNRECDATWETGNVCNQQDGSNSDELKSNYLPVIVGLEVQAKEWLALRGSVSHEIIGTDENGDGDAATRQNKTTVAAGASLTWGDLSVDGMIGNNDAGDGTPGNNTSAGAGQLRTDSLLSRVSLTYKF